MIVITIVIVIINVLQTLGFSYGDTIQICQVTTKAAPDHHIATAMFMVPIHLTDIANDQNTSHLSVHNTFNTF